MDLQKLNMSVPFDLNEISRETPFINVDKFKYFRVTSYSDVEFQMDIVFSPDGVFEHGPIVTYSVNSRWNTRRLEILLPFMKVRLMRAQGDVLVNKILCINFLGRSGLGEIEHKEEPVKEEPVVEQRSKSPFSGILRRGRSNSKHEPPKNEKIIVEDHRLPNFIPRNTILVGSYNNTATIIPSPIDNDSVLIWTDNKFQWIKVSDLLHSSSKSVKFTDIYT